MRATADAVIIGGGVMGCSILYNLAQQGMRDTVLLERDVIASGGSESSQVVVSGSPLATPGIRVSVSSNDPS